MVEGFILTGQVITKQGNSYLRFYLATDDGTACIETDVQTAVFFVAQADESTVVGHLNAARISFSSRALPLSTFQHEPVTALYFTTQTALNKAKQRLQEHKITLFEHDIRWIDRFLMERFIRGSMCVSGEVKQDVIVNSKCKPSDYRPTLKLLSLDIECSEHGELYSVGLVAGDYSHVVMIDQNGEQPTADGIQWVTSETELLKAMVECINCYDPDIIVGWNVINFDMRLLDKRAKFCGVILAIGRDGSDMHVRQSNVDSNQHFVTIAGRLVVDGIDALKTGTYQFDSFSLENVAQSLLGVGKAVDDVDDRMQQITHNFHHDKLALANYNRQDCQLVLDIFEKTQLIDFMLLRSQLTGLSMDKVGGSVAAFTNLYLPKLHRAGYVSPNLPSDGGLASPGGYVMQSIPGLYKNILVLDFKSLYPSIIRTFKIDPMGLIEGLKNPEVAIDGFKGAMFSRTQHFLPDIVTELWQQRDLAKAQRDDARSRAIKIIMNSMYGVLGSGGCRFYDTRLASSITMRGHEIMQTTARWIEQRGHKVIYGDTDSTFVQLGEQVTTEQAKNIGAELANAINTQWQDEIKSRWDMPCHLDIEFETCFQQFLMPTIRGSEAGSKKRYAGTVVENGEQTLVFKGLESVRSDWTALAKTFQQHLYLRVFNGDDVQSYVKQMVLDTRAGKYDQDLVYRKRLRRPLHAYEANVPPHVKAARIADDWYQSQGKPQRYQRRGVIQYIITLAGPQPLEYLTSAIDYDHYISRQLEPVADGILPFVGLTFEQVTTDQMSLF